MNTKKTLEAVIAGGVLVVSLNANAQVNACSNGVNATLTGNTAGSFIAGSASITTRCSANVVVSVLDSTMSFAGKSNSMKGKSFFGGTTEGGAVSVCSTFGTWTAPTASASGC